MVIPLHILHTVFINTLRGYTHHIIGFVTRPSLMTVMWCHVILRWRSWRWSWAAGSRRWGTEMRSMSSCGMRSGLPTWRAKWSKCEVDGHLTSEPHSLFPAEERSWWHHQVVQRMRRRWTYCCRETRSLHRYTHSTQYMYIYTDESPQSCDSSPGLLVCLQIL